MSDEFDATDEGNGIANLRKQYEATTKELAETRKLLEGFQTKERQKSVAEVLKAKGAPPAAAVFYTGDDTSEDAVGAWLDAHRDALNLGAAEEVQDQNAQNAQRVLNASSGEAETETLAPNGARVLGSPEEVLNLIQTLPREELQKLGILPKSGVYGTR